MLDKCWASSSAILAVSSILPSGSAGELDAEDAEEGTSRGQKAGRRVRKPMVRLETTAEGWPSLPRQKSDDEPVGLEEAKDIIRSFLTLHYRTHLVSLIFLR